MKMSEYHFGTLLINTLNMFWIWSKCNLYSSDTPAQNISDSKVNWLKTSDAVVNWLKEPI